MSSSAMRVAGQVGLALTLAGSDAGCVKRQLVAGEGCLDAPGGKVWYRIVARNPTRASDAEILEICSRVQ